MHRLDKLHMEFPFAGSRMLQGLHVQDGRHLHPHGPGFIYLAAVVDRFTRRVLAWRISITLEVDFCIEAVEEALARHGAPEIFNCDQGSQFTSTDFIKVLAAREIRISMDGKGAWRHNVFVERLWQTIEYEEVYLRAYASVSGARAGIGRYIGFYNSRRPHSSLDGETPDQAYFNPSARDPGGRKNESRRRNVYLPNYHWQRLGELIKEGKVVLSPRGEPYEVRKFRGGQYRAAFASVIRCAGLPPE